MINKISPVCLFFALLLTSSFSLAAESINWQVWSPAVFEKAKAEHKYVFIYGKLDSCHWCKAMAATTLQDPDVIAVLNKYYIPIKVDLDKDRDIAVRYRLRGLPSLLILNADDQEVKRWVGYSLPGQLQRMLEKNSPVAATS